MLFLISSTLFNAHVLLLYIFDTRAKLRLCNRCSRECLRPKTALWAQNKFQLSSDYGDSLIAYTGVDPNHPEPHYPWSYRACALEDTHQTLSIQTISGGDPRRCLHLGQAVLCPSRFCVIRISESRIWEISAMGHSRDIYILLVDESMEFMAALVRNLSVLFRPRGFPLCLRRTRSYAGILTACPLPSMLDCPARLKPRLPMVDVCR